jgi:hypothetical protein
MTSYFEVNTNDKQKSFVIEVNEQMSITTINNIIGKKLTPILKIFCVM